MIYILHTINSDNNCCCIDLFFVFLRYDLCFCIFLIDLMFFFPKIKLQLHSLLLYHVFVEKISILFGLYFRRRRFEYGHLISIWTHNELFLMHNLECWRNLVFSSCYRNNEKQQLGSIYQCEIIIFNTVFENSWKIRSPSNWLAK